MKPIRTPPKAPMEAKTTPSVKENVEKFGGTTSKTSKSGTTPPEKKDTPPSSFVPVTSNATKLFKDAIQQLEQSGNIKTTIKATVTNSLNSLYAIIGKLQTEKKQLQEQLNILKATGTSQGGSPDQIDKKFDNILGELRATREAIVAEVLEIKESTLCLPKMGKSIEDNRDQAAMIPELKQALAEVKLELQEIASTTPKQLTYAQMVAAPKAPVHSIIVSSLDDNDTSEEVINKLRHAVDAKTSGIRVDRMRKARDQKVIISCQEKASIDKIKEKIARTQTNLNIEDAKNKNPLVIIKDVVASITDDELKLSIGNQNKHIIGDIPDEDKEITIKFRRRTRNPHLCHIVAQVSPKMWQKLTSVARIHIDFQRVVVQDQTPLIQCSMCLGYGHGRKICTETQPKCSHCGDLHMKADCPALAETPKCLNCARAKNERTDHNTFDKECPVRKRWDSLARTSVAYC
ncbi:hypothetical protein O0L34_g8428 [Tuta absoluta]|nr:hypothetical protein O0L34_g8428 [Tuta absoluta]